MRTTFLAILIIASFTRSELRAESASGTIVGWGLNLNGEATGMPWTNGVLGKDPPVSTDTVMIAGQHLTNVIAIAAGMGRGLALRNDSTVIGWGANLAGSAIGFETQYPYRTNGLVTIGDRVLSNVVAISAGRTHSVALKSDGTVVAWGDNGFGQSSVPAGLRDVTAIAAGAEHTLALKKDGTVLSWGQANRPPTGLSNVVAIAAGRMWKGGNDLALTSTGTVIEWNLFGVEGQARAPTALTNAIAVSAGRNHNLALLNNGTVFGWGDNSLGQAVGIPTRKSPYSASGLVSVDGRILSNVVAIAAGNECSYALKSDTTVIGWGRIGNGRYPASVPEGLSNVVAIAVGESYCLAITTNAAVADRFSQSR